MFKVWTYLHGNSVVSQLTFVRSWCWKFEHLQGSNYVINFICHEVSSYKHLRGSSHLLINFHLPGFLQVINICARTAFESSNLLSSINLLISLPKDFCSRPNRLSWSLITSNIRIKDICGFFLHPKIRRDVVFTCLSCLWRSYVTQGKPLPCWSIKLLPTSGI